VVTDAREKALQDRLTAIHKRVQWMANREAVAAWVNGFGANGEYWPEKERLLDETDRFSTS
jgi:hypothetical protein